MADLSDIMDALQRIALQAVFPNGTSQPSILPTKPPQIAQGWPLAKDIDAAMAAGRSIVSIYAVPSSSSDVGQPFIGTAQEGIAPVHGLAVVLSGAAVTITGTATAGEYVTVQIGGKAYSYVGSAGDSAAAMAAGLAAELSTDYPATTASGATVQVGTNQDFAVRIGAPGTMVDRIHRQRIQFRICVWSPTPADRSAIARVIDVAIKRNLVFTVKEPGGLTSQAVMVFQGTNLDDKYENEGTYRRDLIVNVTYDTTDPFPAYEVTAALPSLSELPTP